MPELMYYFGGIKESCKDHKKKAESTDKRCCSAGVGFYHAGYTGRPETPGIQQSQAAPQYFPDRKVIHAPCAEHNLDDLRKLVEDSG